MIKITLERQSVKEKEYKIRAVEGWDDVKNDISEQKFIDEFAKLFINDKQEGGKPRVDDLAV